MGWLLVIPTKLNGITKDAANPNRKRVNHYLGSEDVVLWRKHQVLRLVNKIANLIDLLLTVSVKHFDGINSKI